MKKALLFIKNEIVLIISFILAVVSMVLVPPSADYFNYIDYKTLALLFCLMCVMAGLNKMGFFKVLAVRLLKRVSTSRGLVLTFVLLCFFSSMLITNDVALITFVPFSIATLKMAGLEKKLIYTVTLETVSANLGSMLTPVGNPQNLYLFSAYNMSIGEFVGIIAPYAGLSLLLLIVFSLFTKSEKIVVNARSCHSDIKAPLLILYTIMFGLSLLGVFRVLNYLILLVIVLIVIIIADKGVLTKVDYSLLLTFVFLFIFIGNLGSIPEIRKFLEMVVKDNEVITGIVSSQVFSNVPATILLSGFTDNSGALLTGVNLGGLGTLIASMASLISFKFIQKENTSIGKYMLVFTIVNIIFLALNIVLWLIINTL